VRECVFGKERVQVSETNGLGILSLVAWSLILVISVKYLWFVPRADYDGEGGILALIELVKRPSRGKAQKITIMLGLFGAALL
jgi:KUP system potassium uptake protein